MKSRPVFMTGREVNRENMTLFSETLFTPRLKLRRMTLEDISLLVRWSNSSKAHGDYLSPEYMSEETCREKLESGQTWTPNNKCFLIEIKDKNLPIGTIHYWLRPEREECAVAKVRIADPAERGKGYGTEAQKYLIINLFDRARVAEVEMYTDINNKAQQRCLNKLGFELIESLGYDDHQVYRLGHLFRLDSVKYREYPVYHYHYE
jgi:RimJ/RimL family protein N-acetyltransferase